MNTKLIAFFAAATLSMAAIAQTQPSGTSNTGTPTTGQSNATSGEQNAAAMQNNSNRQNTKQSKSAKDSKANKDSKNKMDCNQAHTDGHATTPATTPRADCMDDAAKTNKTQR